MTTKRIRCTCGRVYDPVKRPECPDCGAPHTVAEPAREPVKELPEVQSQPAPEPSPVPPPLPSPTMQISPRIIAIGGAAIVLIALVIALSRCGGKPRQENPSPTPAPTATPTPARVTVTPSPQSKPTPTPSSTPTPITRESNPPTTPPNNAGFDGSQIFDLAGAIAKAAPNATIKIPPGFYPGGLVITQPVHLVASAGNVIIQGEGRECLSVRAAGVTVQGVQFICNGVGELPAISITDGNSLELDTCRVQSATEIGITVFAKGSLKTIGTTLTAGSGTALFLEGKADLTQTTFADSQLAFTAKKGANAQLESCAFDRNGAEGQGAIIAVFDEGTTVNATDCRFTNNTGAIFLTGESSFTATSCAFKANGDWSDTSSYIGLVAVQRNAHAKFVHSNFENNRQGILTTQGGQTEIEGCTFYGNGVSNPGNVEAETIPIVVADSSTTTVRQTSLSNSLYGSVAASSGAHLILEEVTISGTAPVGVSVGDPAKLPTRAELKKCHLNQNATGLYLQGGSTATVDDSEFSENREGIVANGSGASLVVSGTKLAGQSEEGLAVIGGASGRAIKCEFRNNERGAQSGSSLRIKGTGSLLLEDCIFSGNRSFSAGAYKTSELTLRGAQFESEDQSRIHQDRNSKVKIEQVEEPSPPPGETPQPSPANDGKGSDKPEPSPAPMASSSPSPDENGNASPVSSPSETPETTESPNDKGSPTATPSHKPHHKPTPRPHQPTPEDLRRFLHHLLLPRPTPTPTPRP